MGRDYKLPISQETLKSFSDAFRKQTGQPPTEEDEQQDSQEQQAKQLALKKLVDSLNK